MNFFIDFEAAQFTNEIISIGCINENGDTFYSLVKPEGKITKFITDLTGITNEMLIDAALPNEVFSDLFDWCMGKSPNEQNVFYCYGNTDVQFLKANIKRSTNFKAGAMLSYIKSSLTDYAPKVKVHYGLIKPIGLQKVINYIRGNEIEQNHNALDDACLLKYVFEKVESSPIDDTCAELAEYRIEGTIEEGPVETYIDMKKDPHRIFMGKDKRGKKIYKGFNSLDDAVEYLITHEMNHGKNKITITEATHSRIMNKIRNAAAQKKKYCDKYWYITSK